MLGVLSGLVTNFLVLRAVANEVAPAEFGVLAFTLQLSAYLSTLQVGLDFAAAREIAERLGRGDRAGAASAYWETRWFNRWAALLAALGTTALVWGGWKGFLGNAVGSSMVVTIAGFAGLTEVFEFVARPHAAALIGSQRQSTVNLINVGRTLGSALLAYLLLIRGWGLVCIPVANAAMGLVSAVLMAWHARGSGLCGPRPPSNPAMMRSLVRFGLVATLGGIAWTIEATSDVLVLKERVGLEAVALYTLWWRFPSLFFGLCHRLTLSAFPGFAERLGRSAEAGRRILSQVGHLAVGLATLALVGIAIWLPAFVRLWVGSDYDAGPGAMALASAMAVLVALRVSGALLANFLLAAGRPGVPTALGWVQAVLKVGLSLSLVDSHGVLGVVLASIVASALQVLGLGVVLARENRLPANLVRTFALLLGSGLAISWLRPGYDPAAPLPQFVGGVILTAAAWLFFWSPLAWHSDLRPHLLAMVRRRRAALGTPPP